MPPKVAALAAFYHICAISPHLATPRCTNAERRTPARSRMRIVFAVLPPAGHSTPDFARGGGASIMMGGGAGHRASIQKMASHRASVRRGSVLQLRRGSVTAAAKPVDSDMKDRLTGHVQHITLQH